MSLTIPEIICLSVAAVLLVASLFVNRSLKKATAADRGNNKADSERASGDGAECRKLRLIVAALDIAALALVIIGFSI